jgi:hypothetical protein
MLRCCWSVVRDWVLVGGEAGAGEGVGLEAAPVEFDADFGC